MIIEKCTVYLKQFKVLIFLVLCIVLTNLILSIHYLPSLMKTKLLLGDLVVVPEGHIQYFSSKHRRI